MRYTFPDKFGASDPQSVVFSFIGRFIGYQASHKFTPAAGTTETKHWSGKDFSDPAFTNSLMP